MSFEKPMSDFIKTTINRPEHCRAPECKMSVMEPQILYGKITDIDKCSPVVDVVNRNVYNRACTPGFHCNVDGNCVKPQDIKGPTNDMRFCENDNDKNCIRELRNCKQIVIKNPVYGEYDNVRKMCYGIMNN